MTQFSIYQLFDLLNRPGPLWLVEANLSGVNLNGGNLENANLADANLRNALLFDALLTGAIMPDGSIRE